MTAAELKERYVYASTKRLPNKTKKDIAKELETLIDDMLTERCGDSEPTEKDMRVIIAELGQPSEIHSKYSSNADKSLISPPYYEPYIFLIKIVTACVFFGITLAIIIAGVSSSQSVGKMLFTWFTTLATSLCISFSFITILFAIFSRKGVDLRDFDDEINNLQPVPKTNLRISKAESIFSIVLCVIFAIVLLAIPDAFCAVLNGKVIRIFNYEVLRSAWVWIILFTGIGIFRESIALIDGKYTKRLLYITFVSNLATVICGFMIFIKESIINQDLILTLLANSHGSNMFLSRILTNANLLFLGFIIFAAILDIADTLWKYYKTEK